MRVLRWVRLLLNCVFLTPIMAPYFWFFTRKFRPGRKVWVFGNGPSLKSFDFGAVDVNDVVLVCNYFCLNEIASKIKITFYCTSDPRLFESEEFLRKVDGLNVEYLVLPVRQLLNPNATASAHRRIFYNYIPYFKLWEETVPWIRNGSLYVPLQCGDTVAFDVMVPLALTLRPQSIEFVGIDLDHSGGVSHSYDEALAVGPRSSDEYLEGEWMANTSRSLDVLMRRTKLGRLLKKTGLGVQYR